jgi:hypothetical protein
MRFIYIFLGYSLILMGAIGILISSIPFFSGNFFGIHLLGIVWSIFPIIWLGRFLLRIEKSLKQIKED